MEKHARPAPDFTPGPALSPRAELTAWLDQQAATTLLRVPLELQVSVLGVTGASIGFGVDRLEVEIDDGALGESLADHAQMLCGDQPTCAMWVWGHWRGGTLKVTKAEAAIAPADRAAATHLFVAK